MNYITLMANKILNFYLWFSFKFCDQKPIFLLVFVFSKISLWILYRLWTSNLADCIFLIILIFSIFLFKLNCTSKHWQKYGETSMSFNFYHSKDMNIITIMIIKLSGVFLIKIFRLKNLCDKIIVPNYSSKHLD